MNQERWRQIERLCQDALNRDPDERNAFLEAACLDDGDLRREVESLIAQEPAARDFLETPAARQPAAVAVEPGALLGPYEITELIGVGGMGEVYRARDTRLGRTVAIKILPPGLAADPERRRRFEHEARAASALEHPNICTLHDVGSDRGLDFLVMEFLEGQTLAERLRKGALPLARALEYGAQIADALGTAHRQGIVHRDLKPANVMLTKSGAKLLDFGVAKLKPRRTGSAPAAPIRDPPTSPGTIVGTVAYMAPEQLEGKEVDARSDLFALGCVLYEMLTGRRAFEGTSEASVISAIMSSQPPPISALQPMTPAALDHLVQTCLAKDPDERMQDAHDVVNELHWLSQSQDGVAPARRIQRLASGERLLWTLATVALLALTVLALLRSTPAPLHGVPPARLDILLPKGVTLATSSLSILTLSPDGRTLVFAGDNRDGRQLYVRHLDRPEAQPLAGTEGGATLPFFSPTGRALGFFLPTGAFMQVPITGGTPALLGLRQIPGGAAWSSDGAVIVGSAFAGLQRLRPGGEKPEAITTLSGPREFAHIEPQILPDGAILFVIQDLSRREEHNQVAVFTPRDRKVTPVLSGVSSPRYVPDGYLLFARGRTLRATRFDLRLLTASGDETILAEDVSHDNAPQWFYQPAGFDVAPQGSLVYVRAPMGSSRTGFTGLESRLALVDRSGREVPLSSKIEPCTWVSADPDGTRLAVRLTRPSGTEIQTVEIARDNWTRVSYGADHGWPAWTPDGSRVVFPSNRVGYWTIDSAPPDGSKTPEPVTSGASVSAFGGRVTVGPAGEVVFSAFARETGPGLWVQKPGAGQAEELLSGRAVGGAVLSPSGRLLAYLSRETGGLQAYLREFPSLASMWKVSTEGAGWVDLRWSRDSSELFFASGSKIMSVRVTTTPQVSVGRPQEILELPGLVSFDVMPDGRFVTVRSVGETPEDQLVVIPDWRRLLPSR
jgi:serine/threonine-protein kinase